MSVGIIGVVVWLVAMAVIAFFVIRAVVGGERQPDRWAEARSLTLTPRSAPYVASYLQNSRGLRQLCAIGAGFVAWSVTQGTGIDLGVDGIVWLVCGYLVGCLWAELTLARVPAGPERIASLTPRRRNEFLLPWIARLQIGVPTVAVVASMASLLHEYRRTDPVYLSPHAAASTAHTIATASLVLTILLTVGSVLAQRHIVRRPQPRTEPDLVAADDAMRVASVHQIGVAHVVAGLLVLGGLLGRMSQFVPRQGLREVLAIWSLLMIPAAIVVWSVRNAGIHPTRIPALRRSPAPVAPEPTCVNAGPVPWRRQSRPLLVAGSAIVGVCALFWGLHWWGLFNPAVAVDVSGSGTDANRDTTALVSVRPSSLARPTLEAVSLPADATDGASIVALHLAPDPMAPSTGPGALDRRPLELPVEVPPDGLTVEVTVRVPSCGVSPFAMVHHDQRSVVLTLRSDAGRTFEVRTRAIDVACDARLPTGPQPADPALAGLAVTHAFDTVYGPTDAADDPTRGALIDDPTGVDVATEAARNGPFGGTVRHADAFVHEVSFDRPDHAWVRYELRDRGASIATRVGEAVLVDGTWKVMRGTICGDLALAGGECPAPLR